MVRSLSTLVAAVAIAGSAAVPVASASGTIDVSDPTQAVFEGELIDLDRTWGQATACVELTTFVECFRTESALLDAYPGLVDSKPTGNSARNVLSASSTCSSSLRLYRSTSYAGGVLYLTTRLVTFNLSSYGFDDDTSSYVVGACSASFYSAANLGGSLYPGSTVAYASSASMLSGWNDVVSSVIIS